MYQVGLVPTGTRQLLENLSPDILILDIGMPDQDPLECIARWKKQHTQIRILIVTTYAEAAVIRCTMNAGANGYVLKSSPSDCLIEAICALMSDNSYFCPLSQ